MSAHAQYLPRRLCACAALLGQLREGRLGRQGRVGGQPGQLQLLNLCAARPPPTPPSSWTPPEHPLLCLRPAPGCHEVLYERRAGPRKLAESGRGVRLLISRPCSRLGWIPLLCNNAPRVRTDVLEFSHFGLQVQKLISNFSSTTSLNATYQRMPLEKRS